MNKTVDREVLAQLRTFLGDEVESLVQEFLTTTPQRLDLFADALEQQNYPAAAQIVHSLKSSSGNLGMLAFSQLCQQFEQGLRRGDCHEVRVWPQQLRQALAEADLLLQSP